MNKANSNASVLSIALDRDTAAPLHAQLAGQLRRLILDRRVAPGERLPSSRTLAAELSVSRVTVTTAIDQLMSEGYTDGRRGSGVYVAIDLPDYPAEEPRPRRASLDATVSPSEPVQPFEASIPELTSFPHRDWARLLDQVWRAPEPALLAKADPFGWPPLRRAIARHLREWRGIASAPAQIVITSGLIDAVELIARAAFQANDEVLIEEPGYLVLRHALTRAGLLFRPHVVDEQGFDIHSAARAHPTARAAVVTPSRQFPLGMTLPLARRLDLLEWATRTGSFVIEDDFDSEYRFRGQPLPALTSLDDRGRVIYVGSFSKVMFPALRLGFMVLPDALVAPSALALRVTGPRASLIAQPALARFMENGAFATHIRRMRRLYAHRQKLLGAAIEAEAGDLLDVEATDAGMHLIVRFRPALARRMTDREASVRLAAAGVTARALSFYFAQTPEQQGLVLGFAGFDDDAIEAGAEKLGAVLAECLRHLLESAQ